MNADDLQYFRDLLIRQMIELQGQAEQTLVTLLNDASDPAASDVLDRASFETQQGFMLRIRDRESRLLGKIRLALTRIEEGEFGLCEMCGEPIGTARLKARPVATLCIACKTRRERRERAVA